MKIAIVRGPSLNKWEMQNFEDLASSHKLIAISSKYGAYDTSEIKLPIKKLWCAGELFSYIPGGINFLYKTFGDTQYLFGLEQAISGFDIVHTAETGNFYSLQAVRAKQRGIVKKVIVTVWETIPFLGDENPKRKEIKRAVIKNADLFLAVTESAKKALIKEGVNPGKVRVVPMGIDLRKFKVKSSKFKVNNKKIILFVGRLVKEKGIYILLEALNRIKERGDWEAMFVGDGPEKENLKFKIQKLKLDTRINIVQDVPYSEIPGIYSQSDILVLPSIKTKNWEEQFGMVLVEAMACGLPVITSDGTTSEVVGKAGIIVPERNSEMLSKSISYLLNDLNGRQKRGIEGRKLVEKFYDSKKISQKIMAIYLKILE